MSDWQRRSCSGRNVPADEWLSDDAVLEFVRSEPGGIGYVAADTDLGDGVKELTVTQ